jgi:hypothetical protein
MKFCTDPQDILVLSCTIASCYYNCSTDCSTIHTIWIRVIHMLSVSPCNLKDLNSKQKEYDTNTNRSFCNHHRYSGSILDGFMWHLWWTKWHWISFSPSFFTFPYSLSFKHYYITTYHCLSGCKIDLTRHVLSLQLHGLITDIISEQRISMRGYYTWIPLSAE